MARQNVKDCKTKILNLRKAKGTRNAKMFFTAKEYSNLKHKHLKFPSYYFFIKDIHERILKEMVIEDRSGFTLPFKLGTFKVVKRYVPHGIYSKGQKIKNEHTLSNTFCTKHLKDNYVTIRYNALYNLVKDTPSKQMPRFQKVYTLYSYNNAKWKFELRDKILDEGGHYDKEITREHYKHSKA